MILFLLSCVSLILLSKSSKWKAGLELLSPYLSLHVLPILPFKKMSFTSHVDIVESEDRVHLLDLPELALDCILSHLPPSGLRSMSQVCSSLRDMCRSDPMWRKHMDRKWGRVIGCAARREWIWFITSRKRKSLLPGSVNDGVLPWSLFVSWFKPGLVSDSKDEPKSSIPSDSIMDWYMSLETGRFWFPAQVYNREIRHVGFMLSCYDADLSYDSRTNTFRARYSLHGRQTIEENVEWDRVREAPVDVPPYNLYVVDSLHDLKPRDHIEIQWRRTNEFPYGWWYGVVGHLESCDGNEYYCHCHISDKVVLEFNQYEPGSRWRRMVISRKDHFEEGNEVDGFYGGIRKLCDKDDISRWKRLWPNQAME